MIKVRGTRDITEPLSSTFSYITSSFEHIAKNWGYSQLILPVLEPKELYTRTLGEGSDIVMKEMFKIQDKNTVLRPEGTAGAMRAYLATASRGQKKTWYYHGPMFRYERPQLGRFREFYQFGVENIGSPSSGLLDADLILMAKACLESIGVKAQLQLNTLGDQVSRKEYVKSLLEYLESNKNSLSELSLERINRGNPLRVLDSKEKEDQDVIAKAPVITEFLTQEAKTHYQTLKQTLKQLEVSFEENPKLVRGLDYYSHTCFEFLEGGLAVLAGGRYDKLCETIQSGKEVPSVGWAAGIDRLASLTSQKTQTPKVSVIPVDTPQTAEALGISQRLRLEKNLLVVCNPSLSSFKQHMNLANKESCGWALIYGEDEKSNGTLTVKNMLKGSQETIDLKLFLSDPQSFLK